MKAAVVSAALFALPSLAQAAPVVTCDREIADWNEDERTIPLGKIDVTVEAARPGSYTVSWNHALWEPRSQSYVPAPTLSRRETGLSCSSDDNGSFACRRGARILFRIETAFPYEFYPELLTFGDLQSDMICQFAN